MTQGVKSMLAPIAVTLALALALTVALAAQAMGDSVVKSVSWVCDVPGEGTVTFVSAPEAARNGIEQANSTAGATFNARFGEVCHVG
jgi:hypothetical protein